MSIYQQEAAVVYEFHCCVMVKVEFQSVICIRYNSTQQSSITLNDQNDIAMFKPNYYQK